MPVVSHALNVTPTVVLIDGLTRSGKSLLGPVLSSFDRVEIERLEPDVEWMGDLAHLGRVERDAAVTFLRLTVDRLFYEGLIGRNTNFRFGDHSSVWRAPSRWRYFRRLLLDERLPLLDRVANERPIFQNMVHHQLMNLPLYAEAFGDRLRMIEMVRDPVDLIDSWMRKDKGALIGNDPLISMVFIERGGRELPWYAAGWEDEYLAASPLDRVIRLIATKWRLSIDAWRAADETLRSRLLMIPFEDFVQRTGDYIDCLGSFVGTRPTRRTAAMLRSQRCPRLYERSKRDERLLRFRRDAGPTARAALDAMVGEHGQVATEIAI